MKIPPGANRAPILFCFCGPSGSGKSSITRELAHVLSALELSISTTTRAKRDVEEDGRDYHFVTDAEFKCRIEAGAFLEYATFGGHFYGTEKRNIETARRLGADLVLDIDLQGVTALKKLYPGDTVTIFVFPPSWEMLKERLAYRGTESEGERARRIEIASGEVKTLSDPTFSDYLLINDTLENAVRAGGAIIQAERLRLSRLSPENRHRLFDL